VTTGSTGTAAQGLREVLDGLVKLCVATARCLDGHLACLADESTDKEKLVSDLDALLKIAERAQKMILQMRKDGGGGPCADSCETFAEAMLEAVEEGEGEPSASAICEAGRKSTG